MNNISDTLQESINATFLIRGDIVGKHSIQSILFIGAHDASTTSSTTIKMRVSKAIHDRGWCNTCCHKGVYTYVYAGTIVKEQI